MPAFGSLGHFSYSICLLSFLFFEHVFVKASLIRRLSLHHKVRLQSDVLTMRKVQIVEDINSIECVGQARSQYSEMCDSHDDGKRKITNAITENFHYENKFRGTIIFDRFRQSFQPADSFRFSVFILLLFNKC